MRRVALVYLICCLAVALPAAAGAQTPPSTASPSTQPPASPPPAGTQPPAGAQPPAGTQAKPAVTAPAPAAPPAEVLPSLFDQTARQIEFGGRFSSVDGDPARFQRYEDIRDGFLIRDARYAVEHPEGTWLFRAAADNIGWRDQRYSAGYERPGRFTINGHFDSIPQFYSVDTATPYTTVGGALVLDDATQRSIQTGQSTLSAYIPKSPKFDLQERRDVSSVNFLATPTPKLDVKASFTTNKHVGELPYGATFGFPMDVEVALPYDSKATDFSLGAEWTNTRNMVNVAYTGSWFDNATDALVWDNPIRIDDSTSGSGRGRMPLWPSNSAQTVSFGGFTKMAKRTQLTGFLSFGTWTNDQPLVPFTINSALTQLALPRPTAEAEASVVSTNLNLVSRPSADWRFGARFRRYDYSNETPRFNITQYVAYDSGVQTSNTGGPELYAHSRATFDADTTWSGLGPVAITAGYTRNNTGHDFRIFESTGEDTFRISADAVGSQWATFRTTYEVSSRTGSGLNEALLTEIGEQPAMRHYDLADRSRNRFSGQVDIIPNDLWVFSASVGTGDDDYENSYFGLEKSSFTTYSLGADYRSANGFGGGATYNYERYSGDQRSRSASAGQTPPQTTDPNRDWTVNSKEQVDYFSFYLTPPRIGRNTEVRLSYDYSNARGNYFEAVVPGGPITPPNQLPEVFNKLQQFKLDFRHRLSKRLAANFAYRYEPFDVYDFAFDQSVVDSIVQPSTLVMGYVYRPYTAHSVVFGLRYFW